MERGSIKKKRRYLRLLVAVLLGLTGALVAPVAANAAYCGNVALKSKANGLYVSAELGYSGDRNGMLRARAGSVGPWERFELCHNVIIPGGVPFGVISTLRSLANGKYVSVEHGYSDNWNNMLRARADSVGSWEALDIDSGNDPARIRDWYDFKIASAELNMPGPWTGMLRARADTVGPWEQWQVVAA
jgi:hypothetical protein